MYVRFLIVVLVNPLFVFKTFRHLFFVTSPQGVHKQKVIVFCLSGSLGPRGPTLGVLLIPGAPMRPRGVGWDLATNKTSYNAPARPRPQPPATIRTCPPQRPRTYL